MSDATTPEPEVPQNPPTPVPPAASAGTPTTPPAAPTAPPAASPYGAPAPGAAPYAAAPAAPLTPENDRQLAMWAHIGGIVGFLPSLIIWLMFKDRGHAVNIEAKEALNWQITFTIIYIASYIVTAILGFIPFLSLILWILPLAVWVLNVIWSIMGGMKVNSGGAYRYPINFRFIK